MTDETNALQQELTALGMFMEEQNADAMKAAEGMEPAELAEGIAFLQDVRHKLGLVERDLTIELGKKMGKGTGNLADGRQFTVARSSDRKEWDHDDWKRDVRRVITAKADDRFQVDEDGVYGRIHDTETGEVVTLARVIQTALAEAQNVHGATNPKSTALKELGLYASDYCTSTPSGWRFTALKPTEKTDTTKDA